MENIIELDIEALRKAKTSLEKAYRIYLQGSDDEEMCAIYADSCVKRFEYTMNNIFRFMESYGFAKNWIDWRDYYSKRNNTAHEYSIEKSRNLIEIIPDFIESVNFLLEKWDAM